jgi:hypothetical protein
MGRKSLGQMTKLLLSFTVHQKGKPQPQHQKGRQSGTLNMGNKHTAEKQSLGMLLGPQADAFVDAVP